MFRKKSLNKIIKNEIKCFNLPHNQWLHEENQEHQH